MCVRLEHFQETIQRKIELIDKIQKNVIRFSVTGLMTGSGTRPLQRITKKLLEESQAFYNIRDLSSTTLTLT